MVCVPDLPSCFLAGDTLDEAMENAKEAIELWLEVAIDDGMAVPEPKPLGTLCITPFGLCSDGLGRSAALLFLPIAGLLAAKRRFASHPDPPATGPPGKPAPAHIKRA